MKVGICSRDQNGAVSTQGSFVFLESESFHKDVESNPLTHTPTYTAKKEVQARKPTPREKQHKKATARTFKLTID